MKRKLNIIGINGSASSNSSNLTILKWVAEKVHSHFEFTIWDDLTVLPHFKTELTNENTPQKVIDFRNQIEHADGIIICTPEYVFSIPSGLKNAVEWCVSTTVFSDKPIGLITASASGEKAHLELKLIMETIQAQFNNDTTLLIPGIKGKITQEGKITDPQTEIELEHFLQSFQKLCAF
jgi:NAD(P)H-dependent FMN reductase